MPSSTHAALGAAVALRKGGAVPTYERRYMPFEEVNAQMDLVNELIPLRDKIQSLVMSNALLNDQRYHAARTQLDSAVRSIIAAADAIGYMPRDNE